MRFVDCYILMALLGSVDIKGKVHQFHTSELISFTEHEKQCSVWQRKLYDVFCGSDRALINNPSDVIRIILTELQTGSLNSYFKMLL